MEKLPPYVGWALLSAIFAALTAVLGKKGVEEVPSNLAVAIRVVVVFVFAAAIAWATKQTGFAQVSRRAYVFLALSGIATGASWLCYYRALQLGPVAKIAPIDKLSFVLAVVLAAIFLHERPSLNVVAGCALIVIGVLLTLRP
ncbi:MAG TPA: EamA family transporter [Armatimonadaceae bacterium]|jgi:transporter family protein|nr:EamA family transporter [Armatimonadaceae bacterium]